MRRQISDWEAEKTRLLDVALSQKREFNSLIEDLKGKHEALLEDTKQGYEAQLSQASSRLEKQAQMIISLQDRASQDSAAQAKQCKALQKQVNQLSSESADLQGGIAHYLVESLKYQVERETLRDNLLNYDRQIKQKREETSAFIKDYQELFC